MLHRRHLHVELVVTVRVPLLRLLDLDRNVLDLEAGLLVLCRMRRQELSLVLGHRRKRVLLLLLHEGVGRLVRGAAEVVRGVAGGSGSGAAGKAAGAASELHHVERRGRNINAQTVAGTVEGRAHGLRLAGNGSKVPASNANGRKTTTAVAVRHTLIVGHEVGASGRRRLERQ